MNESGNRIINDARRRTQNLFKMVGSSPKVEGTCPTPDSCDVCRMARKASVQYQAYLDAKAKVTILESCVTDGSHMESGMCFSERPEVKDELPAFYERFQTGFSEKYATALQWVQEYVAKYGRTPPEEIPSCMGYYPERSNHGRTS